MSSKPLYDEFGNYLGSDTEDEEYVKNENVVFKTDDDDKLELGATTLSRSLIPADASMDLDQNEYSDTFNGGEVVLAENKTYYAATDDLYSPSVEVVYGDEDSQAISVPILEPPKKYDFENKDDSNEFKYGIGFLQSLMKEPQLTRNICIIGALHSGKTLLLDTIIRETLVSSSLTDTELMYMDYRKDERCRGITLKSKPITIALPDSTGKHYLLNIMDTPGHVGFVDEVIAAVRISDGAVLVVDCIMGVTEAVKRLIGILLTQGPRMKFILAISQVDRLILELRIPPEDAFFKLRHIIKDLNNIIEEECTIRAIDPSPFLVSPAKGTVVFCSGKYNFVFNTDIFARMYIKKQVLEYNGHAVRKVTDSLTEQMSHQLSARLWGNFWYNKDTGKIQPSVATNDKGPPVLRTFSEFCLEPIYKLLSLTIGEEFDGLRTTLGEIGIDITKSTYYGKSTNELLKYICHAFFMEYGVSSLVDGIVAHIPDPKVNAGLKITHIYTGDMNSVYASDMLELKTNSCAVFIQTVKNYHNETYSAFDLFGRVYSGTLNLEAQGNDLFILGERYRKEDREDCVKKSISDVQMFLVMGRKKVQVRTISAGNWVLIRNADFSVGKTCTLFVPLNSQHEEGEVRVDGSSFTKFDLDTISEDSVQHPSIFRQLALHSCPAVIKVSCEPLIPTELPKMLIGLKMIEKAYIASQCKREESGEHVVMGTCELSMDCMLHDLRNLYGDLEIKLTDPVVCFAETVSETSMIKCSATTHNRAARINMIASPLESGVVEGMDSGIFSSIIENTRRTAFLEECGMDRLSSRNIWAFGPCPSSGTCVLVNEIFSAPCTPNAVVDIFKESAISGFQWAVREGPLCEDPVRGVSLKVMSVEHLPQTNNLSSLGSGQIIPAVRRCTNSAILTAGPRLMEPTFFVEVDTPADCVSAVYTVISRRRGHILKDFPVPGTPFYRVHAFIPGIETFGFETDLRIHTSGQAFCHTSFDHWSIVPGDPLDRTISLRPLEPAPQPHLAREFVLKTRRRKGISEDLDVGKYFDLDFDTKSLRTSTGIQI